MKLINSVTIEVKKSKFIGYYYAIDSVEDAENVISFLKKEHKKANHIPYAYALSNTARKTDDKEPSNTAGMPIYNILLYKKINNGLIAVVRYFGGTKLGAGLLTRTYSECANLVTKNKGD